MASYWHRMARWCALSLGCATLLGCVAHRGPAPVYYPDRPVYYPPPSGPVYAPAPPPVHHPRPAMSDDRLIEDRVWAALRSDRQLDSRGLSIQVVNGVVMLGGYAPTITHRDRALYTASRVPGVRNVVNQMTLN